MKISESFDAMTGRLSERERRLFGLLALAAMLLLVGGAWFGVSTVFSGIREDIERDRKVLAELRNMAPQYLENQSRKRDLETAVKNNTESVRVMANEILKDIELSAEIPGALGTQMSDIVSFEGKTVETPVELTKAKKAAKSKKKTTSSYIMEEQELKFKEVPQNDLMRFLDAIEKSESLLFVTKIDMKRTFNDRNRVTASVVIATFRYREAAVREE